MSKDIKIVKRDLTIMFSVIVFVIVLFLWTIFFSVKYYNQSRNEREDFSTLIELVDAWKITIADIMTIWSKFDNERFKRRHLHIFTFQ